MKGFCNDNGKDHDYRDDKMMNKIVLDCRQISLIDLPLYCLSVILSFTSCEEDGTCLLLTCRKWTRQYLPIFAVPTNRRRHVYSRIVPIEDASILLNRYNTRRLARRRQQKPSPNNNNNSNNNSEDDERNNKSQNNTYNNGMTTDQLAMYEWSHNFSNKSSNKSDQSERVVWLHPSQELLRWSSSPSSSSFEGICLLASYPRSGNTWMRHLLEKITGVVTGSDTRPDRTLSRALSTDQRQPLVGEGVVQPSRIQLLKTHWPERRGYTKYPLPHRIILLVRNPFDAIDSYWNLCTTNTHSSIVHDDIYELYQSKWQGLVQSEIQTWNQFHQYWHKIILHNNNKNKNNNNVQSLIVRYEDLFLDTEKELQRIIPFIMNNYQTNNSHIHDDNKHTLQEQLWRERIKHVLKFEKKQQQQQQQQQSSFQSIGKSLFKPHRYNESMLQSIHAVFDDQSKHNNNNNNLLKQYGYHIYDQGFPDNWKKQLNDDTTPPLPSFSSNNFNCPWSSSSSSNITVNKGDELRCPTNPYGRAMTYWRRGETQDDTQPFPTQPRIL